MRHLVDHQVDRPAVYVQQCTQPTGTNQSIGLTSLLTMIPRRSLSTNPTNLLHASPGAHTRLEIPVPFPNTAVKQPGPMIVLRAKVGQRRVILRGPLPVLRVERPAPFHTQLFVSNSPSPPAPGTTYC